MDNRRLKVKYDEAEDILRVMVGEEEESLVVEAEKNFYMNLSIKTGEIIGYYILNYSENVHKNKKWSNKLLTIPGDVIGSSFSVKRDKKAA